RTTPGPPANSPAAVDSHRSRAAARCAPAPALRLSAIPPDASLSAPIWPPFGGPIKGTFLSRTKGDTISEAQQPERQFCRPPRGRGQPRCFLLRRSTSRLAPRSIFRRHPLPFRHGQANTRTSGIGDHWPHRCRNFLPVQRLPAKLNRQIPVPPLAHPHLALRRRPTPRIELEIAIRVTHHPVFAHHPLALQSENAIQLRPARRA